MNANINANNKCKHEMNAINKTANNNQNPNLESARRDSLREDGPAQVDILYSPKQSRQLSHPRKTTGGLKQKQHKIHYKY